MILGIKKIVGKMTRADEYGIYRQTEEGYQYLLFPCSTYKDAIKYGKLTAQILSVDFQNMLPSPEDPDKEEEEDQKKRGSSNLKGLNKTINIMVGGIANKPVKAKPRRVSGVAKTVKPLIVEGKTDEQIFQIMLPKYLEANRTEKEARELLLPYLKDIRAGKA